jgi:hypothetical protein
MTNYERILINCETGEETIEPIDAELATEMETERMRIESLPTEKELKAIAKAKESAKSALLEKLGITADEAALLLS